MKKLVRYLKYDMVKVIFLGVTIYSFVMFSLGTMEFGYWLGACALFTFRSTMWEGAFTDQVRDLHKAIEDLMINKGK